MTLIELHIVPRRQRLLSVRDSLMTIVELLIRMVELLMRIVEVHMMRLTIFMSLRTRPHYRTDAVFLRKEEVHMMTVSVPLMTILELYTMLL